MGGLIESQRYLPATSKKKAMDGMDEVATDIDKND